MTHSLLFGGLNVRQSKKSGGGGGQRMQVREINAHVLVEVA